MKTLSPTSRPVPPHDGLVISMSWNFAGPRSKPERHATVERCTPGMRHVPPARAIWLNVDIDRFIPADWIEPMAEGLRWVKEFHGEEMAGFTDRTRSAPHQCFLRH